MSTTESDALAGALEALVLRVPGVTTLYRSGSAVGAVTATVVSALRSSSSKGDRLVLVGESGEGRAVTVTIGIDADSAAEVCRAVHDAIADHLRGLGLVSGGIEVTVAQVVQ